MDFKSPGRKEGKSENLGIEKNSVVKQEMGNLIMLVQKLKDDKKKLQEALRTVITERNEKAQKAKGLRLRCKELEKSLVKESEKVRELYSECQEFYNGRQRVYKQKAGDSRDKTEIAGLVESAKSALKHGGVHLRFDEEFDKEVNKAVYKERWQKACSLMLRQIIKSAKRQNEYLEEDTPQFVKPKAEDKIDRFLENSKALLESLTEQQEKLQRLSKDYYQNNVKSKHGKTASSIPNSVKILSQPDPGRNIKSSLGEPSPTIPLTTKHSKRSALDLPSAKRFELSLKPRQ